MARKPSKPRTIVQRSALTFGLSSPTQMLQKLHRELNRLADASFSRDDLVDHAINFALTAWHITDWVWANPTARRQLSKRSLVCFREELTQQCPELAICQDIANGAKHVTAARPAGRLAPGARDITLRTDIALAEQFTLDKSALGTGALGGPGYEIGGEMFRLEISNESGQVVDAMRVFDAVTAFWTRFIANHGIH